MPGPGRGRPVSAGELDLAAALEVARQAAEQAGAILSSHWGRIERQSARSKSSARDLVTQADLASEAAIQALLARAFPNHAIRAEESWHDGPAIARDQPCWYVDPLDGTVNFLHGLPIYCVSIALWADGRPQVGLVHAPRLQETFHAVRGQGAWLGEQRLGVTSTAHLGEALVATGFPYRRGELARNNLETFGRFFYEVRGLRRMGSAALDLAYVAAGRFDAFWERHLAPHDVAAGGLLVLEAGGLVFDAAGGDDWLFGASIAAAGAPLMPRVLQRLAAD